MDWQAWKTALGLFVTTPELIAAFVVAAIAIFAFAWWLCRQITKGQILALEERLRLAADKQIVVTEKMDQISEEVSQISRSIEGRVLSVPQLAELVAQTNKLNGSIGDLTLATAAVTGSLQLSHYPIVPYARDIKR